MAPGRKGIRYGGRKRGQKNRATIERELIEKREMEARATAAAKRVHEATVKGQTMLMAKEVLEEFMHLFRGMAAARQPLPPGVPRPPGHQQDEPGFEKWSRLAVETARALAPYQSPTFRAIVVAPAPEGRKGELVKRFTLGIFENTGRPAIAQQPQQGNGRDKAN